MTATIFVSGANGYIGRNLLRHFVSRRYRVKALVRHAEAASIVAKIGAEPVVGDLLTTDFASAMAGCDVLVHAAADIDHRNISSNQYAVNVDGTRRIMTGAKAAGLTRAIHLSTDSVLQDGNAIVDATEDRPYPKSFPGMYSFTKAESERVARTFTDDNFAIIILRPRMVWGRDDTTGLPQLIEAVRSGKFAWVSGGAYRNSTTHIGNLCHAVGISLTQGRGGQIYHIADSEIRTFRETVSAFLEAQGLTAPSRSIPRGLLRFIAKAGDNISRLSKGQLRGPLTFQEYATMAHEISLVTTKAQKELGYSPIVSFEQGIEELRGIKALLGSPDQPTTASN